MNYFTPYIQVFNQQKDTPRQQDRLRQREKTRAQPHAEMSRLLSAAVTNQHFCQMLLFDPAKALAFGCNGENFTLSAKEEQQVLAIQADSLQSFASQLLALQENELAAVANVSERGKRELFAARAKEVAQEKQDYIFSPSIAYS